LGIRAGNSKSHNFLNRILFSFSEFAFTALVMAPFAVYYGPYGKFLHATIAAFGLIQLRSKEKDVGILRVSDKSCA
jgi:hypothetical protein